MPGEPLAKTASLWEPWLQQHVTPEVAAARIKDRLLVITGTSTEKGLGYPAVLIFVKHGGFVLLPARTPSKAEDKVIPALVKDLGWEEAAVRKQVATAEMDLCNFATVRSFADAGIKALSEKQGGRFDLAGGQKVDYLVNSAGIMNAPYQATTDGFDHQMQTNVLGHFLLQALITPYLAEDATTVQVGSYVWKMGFYVDLEKKFSKWDHAWVAGGWKRYCQSKTTPYIFSAEADRREKAAGGKRRHVMCQPGLNSTYLQKEHSGFVGNLFQKGAQSAYDGALNYLFAMLKPDELPGGGFVDPERTETGLPRPRKVPFDKVYDADTGKRFWQVCEECVGQTYSIA